MFHQIYLFDPFVFGLRNSEQLLNGFWDQYLSLQPFHSKTKTIEKNIRLLGIEIHTKLDLNWDWYADFIAAIRFDPDAPLDDDEPPRQSAIGPTDVVFRNSAFRATGGPSSSNGFDESTVVVFGIDDDGPPPDPNPGRSRCTWVPSEKCFPPPCRARLAAKWLF